ncbi:MAG: arsenic resistance N-acetyltransferase ArsN2 [Gammaproteobacteria bacterium]
MEQLYPGDFDKVCSLLEENDLLVTDLDPADLKQFLGHREGSSIVAVGGIQAFGEEGLLRSIAIARSRRESGFGKAIVIKLEQRAAAYGIRALYLLTETAPEFFVKLGYEVVRRSEVPNTIRATAQFSELCPASAICMSRKLPPNVKLERTC